MEEEEVKEKGVVCDINCGCGGGGGRSSSSQLL